MQGPRLFFARHALAGRTEDHAPPDFPRTQRVARRRSCNFAGLPSEGGTGSGASAAIDATALNTDRVGPHRRVQPAPYNLRSNRMPAARTGPPKET
jgi:hypothetical protein